MVIIKFSKTKEGAFISNTNMERILRRVFSIASLDIDLKADRKNMSLSFSSPTQQCVESLCEYVRIDTDENAQAVKAKIINVLPSWIKIEKVFQTRHKIYLASFEKMVQYKISFDNFKTFKARVADFFNQKNIYIDIRMHGQNKVVDVKSNMSDLQVYDDGFEILAGAGSDGIHIVEVVKKLLKFCGMQDKYFKICKNQSFTYDDDKMITMDSFLEKYSEK